MLLQGRATRSGVGVESRAICFAQKPASRCPNFVDLVSR